MIGGKPMKRRLSSAIAVLILMALPAAAKYGIKKTIYLGATSTYPHEMAFNPANNKVYCSANGGNFVSVIEAAQESLLTNVPTPGGPWEMVYAQGSGRLFVHNTMMELYAINGNADTLDFTMAYGQGGAEMAYNQAQDKLYLASFTDGLYILNSSSMALLGTIPEINGNIFFAEPVQKMYGVAGTDRIYVVDNSNAAVDSVIQIGILPTSPFGYNPAAQKLYVASAPGELCVIDAVNDSVIATLPLGSFPAGMAYCPLNNAVYVALPSGDLVEVFSDETYNTYATGGVQLSGVVYNPVDSLVYTIDYNISKGLNMMMLFDPQAQAFRDSVGMTGSGMYTNMAVDNEGDVYLADFNYDQVYAVGRIQGRMWRSAFSGQWYDYLNWECSDDGGSNWGVLPLVFPDNPNDSTVLIQAGHTMTLALGGPSITIDQLQVDGVLEQQENSLYLADGPGEDMAVNGVYIFSGGSLSKDTSATMLVNGGGQYQHNVNGGTIPSALWDPNSMLSITQVQDAAPLGMDQAFGNIYWGCPGQSVDAFLPGGPGTSLNNLEVNSTGSGRLILTSSTVPEMTIGGNLTMTGGPNVLLGSGGVKKLTVNGTLNMFNSPPLILNDSLNPGIDTLRLRGDYVYMIAKSGKGLVGGVGPDSTAVILDGGGDHHCLCGNDVSTGYVDFVVEPGNTVTVNQDHMLGTGSLGRFWLMPGAFLATSDTTGAWVAADSGCIRNLGPRIYGPNAGFIFTEALGPGLAGDAVTGNVSMIHAGNSFGTKLMASVDIADSLVLEGELDIEDTLTLSGGLVPFVDGALGYKSSAALNVAGAGISINLQVRPADTLGSLTINRPATVTLDSSMVIRDRLNLYNGVLSCTGAATLFLGDSIRITRSANAALTGGVPAFAGVASLTYNGGAVTAGPELPTSPSGLWDLTVQNSTDSLTVNSFLAVNGSLNLAGALVVNNSDVTLNGPVNAGAASLLANPGGPTLISLMGAGAASLPRITGHNLTVNRPVSCQMQSEVQLGKNLHLIQGSLEVGANALIIGDSLVQSGGILSADSASTIGFGFGTGLNTLPASVTRLDTLRQANPNGLTLAGPVQVFGSYRQQGGHLYGAGLTYGPDATLSYEKTGDDSTSDTEFPDASGPYRLEMNAGAGSVTHLHAARHLYGQLTLGSGVLSVEAPSLYLDSGAVVSRDSGHVAGRLAVYVPAGGNRTVTLDIGDAAHYSPATLTMFNISGGGYVDGMAFPSIHPAVDSVDNCLQRYWEFQPLAVACDSAQVGLTYLPGDFNLNFLEMLHEGAMAPGAYDNGSSSWSFPAVAGRDTMMDDDGGTITLGGIGPFAGVTGFTTGRDQASIHTTAAGDSIGPFIMATIPPDGASGVALNSSIMVSFSEPIDTALFAYSFNPDPGGLSVSWTTDSMTATIGHPDLAPSAFYTVTVLTAPDTAGNPLDTSVVPRYWSFTTGAAADTLPPAPPESLQIYGYNPSNWLSSGSVSVPVGWVNPVDPTGIAKGYYKVYSPPVDSLDFTDSLTAVGGARDTFYLAVDTLNGSMPVYLWLRDGAGNSSWLNNAVVAARRDTVPPFNITVNPFVNDTVVTTTFTVNWNPGGDALSGIRHYQLRFSVDSPSVWTTWADSLAGPSASFTGAVGHSYYFEASGTDSAGNAEPFLGAPEASVYVGVLDVVRPYIASASPSNGQTNVAVGQPVIVIFSEPVDTASLRFTCIPDPGAWTQAWSGAQTVTLGHYPLAQNTAHTFRVDSVADLAGNAIDTSAAPNQAWSFTTVGPTTMATSWGGGVWRLWSVPMMPQDTSAMTILGDDLGAYSDTTWKMQGYKTSSGYVDLPAVYPGYGYWLASAQGATIDVQGALLSGIHTVPLDSGWNIVGDPFDSAASLSGLRVRWNDGTSHELPYGDTLVNAVLRQVMHQYLDNTPDLVNNGYWDSLDPWTAADSLRPWQGYAAYAVRSCSLVVERGFKKGGGARPEREILWQLGLSAAMGPWTDRGLRVGVSPQASPEYDRLDAEKPPLVSDRVAMYLPHHDWGQGPCHSYMRDIRPPGSEQRWEVKVDAAERQPVGVHFALDGRLEPLYHLYIVNKGLGQAQEASGSGRLDLDGGGDLEVIYTSRSLAELELKPVEFGLTRIHPNPFRGRAVIDYQLEKPGRVSLKVYNSLGQLAAVLVDGQQEAGFHAAVWDGTRASAGVYLVRLESEGRTRVTKTVKLR